jgi:hypothetical protein
MADRKLELAFVDKDGRTHSIDEGTSEDLAKGLEKIAKEIAKRLQLLKEQR